ncbi:MAG: response regulator [Rubripirellula sp.]
MSRNAAASRNYKTEKNATVSIMKDKEELTPEAFVTLLHQFALDLLQRSTLDEIFWLIADRMIAGIGFDVILMDVLMPECDGMQATKRIRKLENKREGRVPIIALTAQALAGDRDACLEAGMDAYVSKPISQTQLHTLMEQYT